MSDNNLSVKIRVARINEFVEELKEDFAAYIKDKSFPLEERWKVFSEANCVLSYHQSYIPKIPCLEDDYILQHFEGLGQVPVVNMVEFVNDLYEINYSKDGTPAYEDAPNLLELKEWILENNIRSFSYTL